MSDYISRQDVLNLPQSIERNLRGEIVERSIDVKDIEALKSADVVPVVHSEWIYHMSYGVCKKCSYEYEWKGTDAKNYCPNCGAKMDAEGEE